MNIKSEYKISEISKLFNIGVDSLRYYEKIGILKPIRNPDNNYRIYTFSDIKKLNLLKELIGLKFSLKDVKSYFENRNIDSTKKLLTQEIDSIYNQITLLNELKSNIELRISNINNAVALPSDDEIKLVDYQERYCVVAESDGNTNDELYYITSLFLSHTNEKLYTIGNTDCYFLSSTEDGASENYLKNKKLFLILNKPSKDVNLILPSGLYATVVYKGSLKSTKYLVQKMLNYIRLNNLRAISEPIEMCKIDTFETDNENEYVTELQIQVEKS